MKKVENSDKDTIRKLEQEKEDLELRLAMAESQNSKIKDNEKEKVRLSDLIRVKDKNLEDKNGKIRNLMAENQMLEAEIKIMNETSLDIEEILEILTDEDSESERKEYLEKIKVSDDTDEKRENAFLY